MTFIDFGAACTWTDAAGDENEARTKIKEDSDRLYVVLLDCFNLFRPEIRPLLRNLPRECPIPTLLHPRGIQATYEEQLQEPIEVIMSIGVSEQVARKALSVVSYSPVYSGVVLE